MESFSTVTSKGQVTIPLKIRRHLGIDAADKVAFVVSDDGVVVIRPARATVASLYGVVPALPADATQDIDEQIREAMDDDADRLAHEVEGR